MEGTPSICCQRESVRKPFGQDQAGKTYVCVVLSNTVPVNRRTVVLQVVGDMDLDGVTPIRDDGGARNGAVDGENDALNTVRGSSAVLDAEPVLPSNTRVRNLIVVVGGDVVVSPARPVGSAVHASFGQDIVKGKTWKGEGAGNGSQGPESGRKHDGGGGTKKE